MIPTKTCDVGVNIDKEISGMEKRVQKLLYTCMDNYLFTEAQRPLKKDSLKKEIILEKLNIHIQINKCGKLHTICKN